YDVMMKIQYLCAAELSGAVESHQHSTMKNTLSLFLLLLTFSKDLDSLLAATACTGSERQLENHWSGWHDVTVAYAKSFQGRIEVTRDNSISLVYLKLSGVGDSRGLKLCIFYCAGEAQ
ncbi:hypothetical protein NFI96_025684, partial [Prochilodus magdalenae]